MSLAVLGDDSPDWRPNEYRRELLGCELRFRFGATKLLDWSGRVAELLANPNPAALVVLAHLDSLATHGDPHERHRAKWRLIRLLYERGWTEERIRQMFRLVNWLLELPPDLERQFRVELQAFEEERHMPYVTTYERLVRDEGVEQGLQQGLQRGLAVALEVKFGEAGVSFAQELNAIADLNKLRAVEQAIRTAASVDELRPLLR